MRGAQLSGWTLFTSFRRNGRHQTHAALGRRDEARALFEKLLACRNRHGLLAEHVDVRTGEHWGNFVQTYSMVGIISSAIRLSVRWDMAR